MKSNLIYALLATGMLASCSQEDVIQEMDTSQSAIGFSTFVDKASRAETTTTANLKTFNVWGTKFREGNDNAVRIMDGTKVTKDGDTWAYSPTKYWVNSNAYSFTAIGSSNANITKYYNYTAPSIENISYDTYLTHYMGNLTYNNKDANGSADLIWASEKVATIPEVGFGPTSVNFTFGHLLSRVRLKFVNIRTIENENSVTLKNVNITSASSGTLDFSQYNVGVSSTEFKWTPSSDNFNCAFSFLPNNDIEYTLVKNSNVLTFDQFLIPSQGSITVSFDCYTSITKEDGENAKININKTIKFGDSGSPSPFENLDLKPGYSYTLVAYLTDNLDNSGKVKITAEVVEYIENSAPAYAMEFYAPSTIYTSDTETNPQYQTISIKEITTTDELVYYGKTVNPTEITYSDYTYEWTIPTNVYYTLQKSSGLNGTSICTQTVTAPSSVNDIKVTLYVNGNYSPDGSTTTNTGDIPVTLTVKDKSSGSIIISKTVNVPVKYTASTTGGSQDGDDNDG